VRLPTRSVTVRLLGIDCPETRNTKRLEGQAARLGASPDSLMRLGVEAAKHVRDAIGERSVRLDYPGPEPEQDFFGRTLAYVSLNSLDIGGQLLRLGLASPGSEDHPREIEYRELSRAASGAKLGIYGLSAETNALPTLPGELRLAQ